MKDIPILKLLLIISVSLFSCRELEVPVEVSEAIKEVPNELDYNFHVKPILSDKCFAWLTEDVSGY